MMGFIDDYTIEECCDILDNLRVPLNSDQRFEIQGEYPYYGANGVQGFISKYVFDDDLILIAEDGGNFEQFATKPIAYRVKGKCWVNNHAHVLKAKKEFSQDFIFYSLEHKNILFFIAGGTRSKLTQGELRKITLKHPEKKEADKIGEILSMADAAIAQTEALIAKYQRIKTGLMQDLLTRGIDANGNIRSKATHRFVVKNGIEVPEEWEVVELGEYSFVTKLAGFEYTLHIDYSIGGEIIAIRGLNLKHGELDLRDIQTIPKATSDYLKRSNLHKGDLVISYVGTVGEMAVIDEDNKYHLAPNVAKISVKRNRVNPWFLKEYLFSHAGKQEIANQTASTTQAALSMGNLRKLKIILPEKSEQDQIVAKLSGIQKFICDEKIHLTKLDSLKTGLMQDLLSGRVRVKVNNG